MTSSASGSQDPAPESTGSSSGKTHRRVSSLIREFDLIAHFDGDTVPVPPPQPSRSPSSSTSQPAPLTGGTASISSQHGLSVAPPIQTSRRLSSGHTSPIRPTFAGRTPSPSKSPSGSTAHLHVSGLGMDRSSSSSSEGSGAGAGRRPSHSSSTARPHGNSLRQHHDQPRSTTHDGVGALGLQYGVASTVHDAPNGSVVGSSSPETEEEDDAFVPLGSGSASEFTFAPGPSPQVQGNAAAPHERHTRRHSRLHSRNLSVFFPRPGQEVTGTLAGYNDPPDLGKGPILMPSAKIHSYAMPGTGGIPRSTSAPFRSPAGVPNHSPSDAASPAVTGRRGHHHRHSLSHNFFSFLEPHAGDGAVTPTTSPTTPLSALPKSVPHTLAHHRRTDSTSLPANATQSLRSRYAHLPLPLRVVVAFAFHTPHATQVKVIVGFATLFLGGALWILGQAGESLASTGLGYLVVFDGVGALSRIWVEGRAEGIEKVWDAAGSGKHGQSGLRFPFGLRRHITLAHFAQCVYLLFSAVYVCKEAVEHVLLLHGPGEDGGHNNAGTHGSAHGSMGHGEALAMSGSSKAHAHDSDIGIPSGILFICFVCCLFSALGSGNHAGLAEASGPSNFTPLLASPRGRKHSLGDALMAVIANPFVLITLLFSGGIALASVTLQSEQMAPLDKVLALLESAAMFYIAYPAAVATGSVLLQTAPPLETGQMAALQRGIRQISDHPLVTFIQPPRIWQMTPQFHTAKPQLSGLTGRPSPPTRDAQASVVVASITVHTKEDATDGDILEVTRFAREKCAPALRWAAGLSRDLDQRKGSIDAGAGGELTVAIVRGFSDKSSRSQHSGCHGH